MPAPPAPPRCAELSRLRADDPNGSAAPTSRWLLIEQPGPWGRDALLMSQLDREVAVELSARTRAAGVRVMLVRRPGRTEAPTRRRVGWAESTPGRESLCWSDFADDRSLLDLPLDGSAGQPDDEPAFLVCTHGRHDACCAIRGRPAAAALAARRPAGTWECSHTGGDRFAANVVVLPHGLYYGTVTPDRVDELVAAQQDHRVVPDLLRGRSAFGGPVQAAQHHARAATGDYGLDSLAPHHVETVAPSVWRVTFGHPGGDVSVLIRRGASDPLDRLTCAATRAQPVATYERLSVSVAVS